MAQDPLSTPDGQAVPQTASRQPVQARVRAALAGGERFSRHKRLLGSALRGKSDASREHECYLRVLTHNLMLLAATG